MKSQQTPPLVQAAGGIAFPQSADGERSSTRAGAQIVAAALAPLDPAFAAAALHEKRWRRAYPTHFRRLVEGGLASPQAARDSARAGLDAAWHTLCWQHDGAESSLRDALAAPGAAFDTLCIQGQGEASVAPWTVPLRGEQLAGERLRAQLADWQSRGIIEPGAVLALQRCIAHPHWFDLSDRTMVLLGAGSEAGPLRWLARWRANIVAVDVARADVWRRIAAIASAGNGTLRLPVRAAQRQEGDWHGHAGADLITQAPEIAAWLRGMPGPLDIAALAYLDGERHVRVAMGMDMVIDAICAANKRTSIAFLATPTDVFAVAADTARAAMDAWAARPLASRALQGPLRLASGDRLFQPNIEHLLLGGNGVQYGVVDSLVIEQGPNYALAKRLQQWRALRARAADHRVSLNVAPSTTTASVVKNPALAAGFAGADSFGIEVFEPETTNALMAALWVHDLRCDEAAANPARTLAHPFELFMDNACHGGLWRSAYLPRSALPFAAALGWVRQRVGARP